MQNQIKRCSLLFAIIILLTFSHQRARAEQNPFIGEIILFAGDKPPRGWMFCEGQEIKVQNNDALFALLGTTYGGNGRTTFALPDLRKAEKLLHESAGFKQPKDGKSLRYIIAIYGIFPSRS